MLKTGWFLSLLFSSSMAFAVSEEQYERDYERIVAPYLLRHGADGALEVSQGHLHYRKVEPRSAVGTVVLVPGAAESFLLYGELMHDLAMAGLRVFALDPRGQGLSRLPGDTSPLLNVDSFDTHVADLEIFVQKVVQVSSEEPFFLFGGSSGAIVAGLFTARNPGIVRRLVLSSPLLDLRMKVGVQNSAASFAFLSGQVLLGKALQAAPVTHFALESWESPESPLSSSASRRAHVSSVLKKVPGLASSGVTNLWAKGLADAAFRLESDAHKIKAPVLIFQPQQDVIARQRPQLNLCRRIAKCVLKKMEGSRHKVFFEGDAIRQPALEQLFRFFEIKRVKGSDAMALGPRQTL